MAKERTAIPPEVAARVLFSHDRICCVCRVRGKAVQIHHIDEDPTNHEIRNLAALCLECHNETQIKGGFGRKLNADQIILYRDDWVEQVALQRAKSEAYKKQSGTTPDYQLEYVTSVAEAYRENEEYSLLAAHYHSIGNKELRDKYINLALGHDPDDHTIVYLRKLQDRPDLIPADVIEREMARYTEGEDWSQRARFLLGIRRYAESAIDYMHSVSESLIDNRFFPAAFYLKELSKSGLYEQLFVLALKQAQEADDLWWQVRALQELGWDSELRELLLSRAGEIEQAGNIMLQSLLANARGEIAKAVDLEIEIARRTRTVVGGGVAVGAQEDQESDSGNEGSTAEPSAAPDPARDIGSGGS